MVKRAEAAIQKALVAWIKDNYPFVRVNATLNENSRHELAMGVDVGITDLILTWHKEDLEYNFYLELKKKKGRLSQSEIEWAARFVKCRNNHYAVAYGFSHAKEILCHQL